jgi:LacI family transcriptional regulator
MYHLADYNLDGIVANVNSAEQAKVLARLDVPLVNVSAAAPEPCDFPTVVVDPTDVAMTAARHFIERGFRNFAFFDAFPGHAFMAKRGAAFRDYLDEQGYECEIYESYVPFPTYVPRDLLTELDLPIVDWLSRLPKPCGVFTGMDRGGRKLCWICNLAGLHVPEDIAVLGVDNFAVICETSFPPLSSVRVPSTQIGYRAAERLDFAMQGAGTIDKLTVLPAAGVEVRQSTDIMAVEDRTVASALQYIRTHVADRVAVSAVARHVGINRRSLERRFRASLRRTPLQEIHRVMVERAKSLLTDTDEPIPTVAQRAGFRDSNHLNLVLRKVLGMTPTAFRRQFRSR